MAAPINAVISCGQAIIVAIALMAKLLGRIVFIINVAVIYKNKYLASDATMAADPKCIFRAKLKTIINIAFEIIINGTIGAKGIGNKPDDKATTDGTNPINMAFPVPNIAAPKNNVALIIGPVINWL